MAMGRASSVIEKVVNLLVAIAVVTFVAAVVSYARSRSADDRIGSTVEVGQRLMLPGTEGSARKKLIVALQAECAYCEESMPFYKDLLASGAGDAFDVVAVVPHAPRVGRELLRNGGVDIAHVVTGNFAQLKIAATPTLVVVDESGVVQNVWIGKLTSRTQGHVFDVLGLKRRAQTAATGPDGGQVAALRELLSRQGPLIDTRPRDQFNEGSIAGSLNIPLDEIDARLLHEVPLDAGLVVYCDVVAQCPVVFEAVERENLCDRSLLAIQVRGYRKAQVINEELETLAAAGFPVVRKGE